MLWGQKGPGFLGVYIYSHVDFRFDLEKNHLPFDDCSIESLVCIS